MTKVYSFLLYFGVALLLIMQLLSLAKHTALLGVANSKAKMIFPRNVEEGHFQNDRSTIDKEKTDHLQHQISVPFLDLQNLRWTDISTNISTTRMRMIDAGNSSRHKNDRSWWQYVNWMSLKQKPKCSYILDSLKNQSSIARSSHRPELENQTVKLLIIDPDDYGSGKPMYDCIRKAAQIVGPQNVHVAARALVRDRDFSCFDPRKEKTTCWSNTSFSELNGTVWDYPHEKDGWSNYIHNGVIAKWDFGVRETILEALNEELGQKLGLEQVSHEDYFHYYRPMDVAHFWNVEPEDPFGQLRNTVTQTIQHFIEQHNYTGTAGLVSKRGKVGRNSASELYASAMLEHKIIVVTQRDSWEDQLRLMESLISGAMVMSDPVTSLPAGLEEGKHIVIFNSLDELTQKLVYYLNDKEGREERIHIAKAGRRIAMEQHRSSQRIERLVLADNWPLDWKNPVAPLLN